MKSVIKDVNAAFIKAANVESSSNSLIPVVNVSTSIPPQSPALKGNIVYDVISDQIWFANGTTWAQIAGGGGSPSGPAGGVLAGTYPNPTLAAGAVTTPALAPGAVTTPILSDTTVVPNTYGNATTIPQITVDQKGRVTNVTPVAIGGGSPSGPAGGSLSGTYPNPGIASGAVTSTEIALATITAANIANATITNTQIANTTITGGKLVNNTITSTQLDVVATGATVNNPSQIVFGNDGRITSATAGTPNAPVTQYGGSVRGAKGPDITILNNPTVDTNFFFSADYFLRETPLPAGSFASTLLTLDIQVGFFQGVIHSADFQIQINFPGFVGDLQTLIGNMPGGNTRPVRITSTGFPTPFDVSNSNWYFSGANQVTIYCATTMLTFTGGTFIPKDWNGYYRTEWIHIETSY